MLLIFDIGVSEGRRIDLLSSSLCFVRTTCHQLGFINGLSFMFLFMCNVILFRGCNVVLFYG